MSCVREYKKWSWLSVIMGASCVVIMEACASESSSTNDSSLPEYLQKGYTGPFTISDKPMIHGQFTDTTFYNALKDNRIEAYNNAFSARNGLSAWLTKNSNHKEKLFPRIVTVTRHNNKIEEKMTMNPLGLSAREDKDIKDGNAAYFDDIPCRHANGALWLYGLLVLSYKQNYHSEMNAKIIQFCENNNDKMRADFNRYSH